MAWELVTEGEDGESLADLLREASEQCADASVRPMTQEQAEQRAGAAQDFIEECEAGTPIYNKHWPSGYGL